MSKNKVDLSSIENDILTTIMEKSTKQNKMSKTYGRVNLAFDQAILDDVRIIARIEDRSINDICTQFIFQSLSRYKKDNEDVFESAKKLFRK